MDFDLSKENIQPLRGGRNVQQLGMALQAQTNRELQMELLQQREEFENLIRTYTGDDPLENHYNFISWVEQSYPKHGHEGNVVPLLEHCLSLFEKDKRYTNDRRFCKLWIKYFDLQQNPLELYQMLRAKGLCIGCSDLYRAWAYYHEAAGDFKSANNVFEEGKRNLAQPYEELDMAHKNFMMAAGQYFIFGRDESRLIEKRHALTSLHTYRSGRVGSVRVPNANGLPVLPPSHATVRPNAVVPVYSDGEASGMTGLAGIAEPPISIITAAKSQSVRKENTMKPGPWTSVPVKKRVVGGSSVVAFTVHEDDLDTYVEPEGIRLPKNHPKQCLEDYSDWKVSIKYLEPPNAAMVPMYPKERVYRDLNTEYSIEELRAHRYRLKAQERQLMLQQQQQIEQLQQQQLQQQQLQQQQEPIEIFDDVEFMQESMHEDRNDVVQRSIQQNDVFHRSMEVHQLPAQQPTQYNSPALLANTSHQLQISGERQRTPLRQESPANSILPWAKIPTKNDFDSWEPSLVSPAVDNFVVFEESMQQVHPKGSAMKTAFKVLNADELAETGSRGGMDIAETAHAGDSAKPMPLLFGGDRTTASPSLEDSFNTVAFNFNLKEMQVSTPVNKRPALNSHPSEELENSRKQLFLEPKALSIILEETKSDGSSSSSCGAATKSSIFNSHANKMGTISEEHNKYLYENMQANAALREASLASVMDVGDSRSQEHHSSLADREPVVPMQGSPLGSPVRECQTSAVISPIDYAPSDPFKPNLISHLLEKVNFPGQHTRGYIDIPFLPRITMRKEPINIGSQKYVVDKQLGKGAFGVVFKALDIDSNVQVALKYQKPANKWEFYICRELQVRLSNHLLRERFMDVSKGYFCEQMSILVSEYMPGGSLLDLANTHKQKLGKSMKECLVIYFCIQMLQIIQAMHEVGIVHADIKPDNFLVFILPDNSVGLQLIDFGCSIDMTLFPPNTMFTRKVTTEDFVCCEMLDGRPWSYHTDLFCVAATAHVLLFESYIKLRKVDGYWTILQRFSRYLKVELWNIFFSNLLNQHAGPADSVKLQQTLQENLDTLNKDSGTALPSQMRAIVNLLNNR